MGEEYRPDHDTEPVQTGPREPATHEAPKIALDHLLDKIVDVQRARHRSEGIFARGGMGTVETAIDRTLLRRVALKRVHETLRTSARDAEMFAREARITGQLQHPCIVPIYEMGVDESRRLYYTMELLAGRTLEAWIDALPPGPLVRSTLFDLLEVVVRVCDALSYAHSRGVLHCDVKPANVMVGSHGRVYLMDWGIARLVEEESARDPTVPVISGTPMYVAPEQARGEVLDERADVFAAGGLIYTILTRRAPFAAQNAVQALVSACLGTFAPIEGVPEAAFAPPALRRIVSRAMAKDRAERYASVAELRDALVRFVRGVDAFPRVVVSAGEDVVREGERGGDAYVIESGSCEVHRLVGGRRTTLRVMHAGDVFGETAILAPGERTATVTALEPTTLLRINAETLQTEVDSMKPWMGALVRTLAERFRDRETER